MANIGKWQVWRAVVKFDDSDETKERPVLIWNVTPDFISVFKITSVGRGDIYPEHVIKEWQGAGLPKPSSVRFNLPIRLLKAHLISQVGELQFTDRFQIEQKMLQKQGRN